MFDILISTHKINKAFNTLDYNIREKYCKEMDYEGSRVPKKEKRLLKVMKKAFNIGVKAGIESRTQNNMSALEFKDIYHLGPGDIIKMVHGGETIMIGLNHVTDTIVPISLKGDGLVDAISIDEILNKEYILMNREFTLRV